MQVEGIRALIIDDDPLIGDLLQHFCKKSKRFAFALTVENCTDGLQLISTEDFDLIFLDYNLPDMSGRSFLELLPAGIDVVMVTSESGFAADSFSYASVKDFLTKPLSYDRFMKIFDRLEPTDTPSIRNQNGDDHIFLKEGHALVRVPLAEILFIKSEGNYLIFKLKDRQIMSLGALSKMAEELPAYFGRCHRSYLVNLKQVIEVHPEELIIGSERVPLGLKYKNNLIESWKSQTQ